jgi:hypothetical protein
MSMALAGAGARAVYVSRLRLDDVKIGGKYSGLWWGWMILRDLLSYQSGRELEPDLCIAPSQQE